MAKPTTLGALIDAHFNRKLRVTVIRDLPIEITNTPHFDQNSFTVKAEGVPGPGGYPLFPETGMALTDIELTLIYNGRSKPAKGKITATMAHAGVTISVTVILSKDDEELNGTFKNPKRPFSVNDALAFFGIGAKIPASFAKPEAVDLAQFKMSVNFTSDEILLSGKNSCKDSATLYAHRPEDKWQFALLVEKAAGWKLASLGKPLGIVDDFVSFKQAFIGIATHDNTLIDKHIHPALGKRIFKMHAGLNVGLAVKMNAQQSSALAKMLRGIGVKGDMFLTGSIGAAPKDVTLSAGLGEIDLKLAKKGKASKLKISNCEIDVSLGSTLTMFGAITLPSPEKGKVIEADGSATLTADSFKFTGHSKISADLGNGFVLEDIDGTIGLSPAGLIVGLGGGVKVGSTQAMAELQLGLPELEPVFFETGFKQLDLRPLFQLICHEAKLPAPLSKGIVFNNLDLWDCNDPGGCGSHGAGMSFAADAVLFGIPTKATIKATTAGMEGSLSTAKAISIPGFSISDPHDHSKGPHFSFKTASAPYLDVAYRMDVFGYADDLTADFDDGGFRLAADVGFGKMRLHVDCSLQHSGRGFAGAVTCNETFRKPVRFGSTKSSVYFDITKVGFTLSSKGYFKYSVDGKAHYHGVTERGPITGTITVRDIERRLVNIGRELERELSDVTKWL